MGVVLGAGHKAPVRSIAFLNVADCDQVEELKAFIPAIFQERTPLAVLRTNTRSNVVIKPRIQAGACNAGIFDGYR